MPAFNKSKCPMQWLVFEFAQVYFFDNKSFARVHLSNLLWQSNTIKANKGFIRLEEGMCVRNNDGYKKYFIENKSLNQVMHGDTTIFLTELIILLKHLEFTWLNWKRIK